MGLNCITRFVEDFLLAIAELNLIMLKLIVNADDFGHSDIVNKAVLTSYQNGILRSASLMANGSSFENAAR